MYKNKIYRLLLPVVLLVLTTSCEPTWEEHYQQTDGQQGSTNFYQGISALDELSDFRAMLEATGYDSILSKPVTYTVWAPLNSAELNSIVQSGDVSLMKQTVENHISRFSYPTSGIQSKTIYMLNKKFITFKREGSGFSFGGKPLSTRGSNLVASNGIMHIIEGHVPYLSNIWEFILKTPGLDSIRTFLDASSIYAFDPVASVEIGTNEFGQAVYDSVITFSNVLLDKIGSLHLEDSLYSVLLPDNNAWTTTYNLIKDKYKTLLADGGAPKQRQLTQVAMVNNLIFKTLTPETDDSIISTTGSIFREPSYLFEASQRSELSNGVVFVTDSLRFKLSESWQQSIVIEAENSDYGRGSVYCNLFVRSGLGTPYSAEVSDTKYLLVEPTTVSTTQPASVTFPIPNVLSGKYRIYCVTVPSNIVTENDNRPYKLKFYVTHRNTAGVVVENAPISSANQLQATNRTAFAFPTKGGEISKTFITEIEFPYSNILEDGASSTTITTKIKVENGVTAVEDIQKKGDKKMRIDYIILEPVQ